MSYHVWVVMEVLVDTPDLGSQVIGKARREGENHVIVARYDNTKSPRMVRSSEDPFEAAAKVVRVGDDGTDVGEVTKDHWTAKNHRRWG